MRKIIKKKNQDKKKIQEYKILEDDLETQINSSFKQTCPIYTTTNLRQDPWANNYSQLDRNVVDIGNLKHYIHDFCINFKNNGHALNSTMWREKIKSSWSIPNKDKEIRGAFTGTPPVGDPNINATITVEKYLTNFLDSNKYKWNYENTPLTTHLAKILLKLYNDSENDLDLKHGNNNNHNEVINDLNLSQHCNYRIFEKKNNLSKMINISIRNLCFDNDKTIKYIQNITEKFIGEKMGFGSLESKFYSIFAEYITIIKQLSEEYNHKKYQSTIFETKNPNLNLEYPYAPVHSSKFGISHIKKQNNIDDKVNSKLAPNNASPIATSSLPMTTSPVSTMTTLPVNPPVNSTSKIPVNGHQHPRLSKNGIDIFRYIGQILRKKYNVRECHDLIQNTVYIILITSIIKSFIPNIDILGGTEEDNKQNYIYLVNEIIKKFILKDDILIQKDLIYQLLLHEYDENTLPNIDATKTNKPPVTNPPTITPNPKNYDGRLINSYNFNENMKSILETIIEHFYLKKQYDPKYSQIESILKFAKIDGMTINPEQITSHYKKFYKLDKKENLLKKIKEKEGTNSDVNIHEIITNLDTFTSDNNLSRVTKYIKINSRLTKHLLKRKCNINAIDKFNKYPLHYAISYLGIDVIQLLIEKNAKIFSSIVDSGRKGYISPYDYLIKSFENYNSVLEKQQDSENDQIEFYYDGLWKHTFDFVNNTNKEHSLPIFKHIFEEFIRNINRHIIYPNIMDKPNYNQCDPYKIHFRITEQLQEFSEKIKSINSLRQIGNISRFITKNNEYNELLKFLLQPDEIINTPSYSPQGTGSVSPNVNMKRYKELIGVIHEIQNGKIILKSIYPNLKLNSGDTLEHNNQKYNFISQDKNELTVNPLGGVTTSPSSNLSDNTLDQIYLYRMHKYPVYKLRDYHNIIIENEKIFNNIDNNIPDVKPVQNGILNRIIHATVINIIDEYILRYDILELFVNNLYGLYHENKLGDKLIQEHQKDGANNGDKANKIRDNIKDIIRNSKNNYLKDNFYKFGIQCIDLFFYKHMSIEEIENKKDDPLISLDDIKRSIVESVKAVGRESHQIELTETDEIIKQINDNLFKKYTEIFHLFLTNLRKLFLHYINYIENQYRFLQIIKIVLEKAKTIMNPS